MGEIRFIPRGSKTGFHNCNVRSLPLRLTRREWAIVQQAIATIDCRKCKKLGPMPRELEWLRKKIESKLQGEKVPRKSERRE